MNSIETILGMVATEAVEANTIARLERPAVEGGDERASRILRVMATLSNTLPEEQCSKLDDLILQLGAALRSLQQQRDEARRERKSWSWLADAVRESAEKADSLPAWKRELVLALDASRKALEIAELEWGEHADLADRLDAENIALRSSVASLEVQLAEREAGKLEVQEAERQRWINVAYADGEEIMALNQSVASLREALRKYGKHTTDCPVQSGQGCECGLEQLLEPVTVPPAQSMPDHDPLP